uniref:Uncharacterized protein n=1 Tax=Eutreptiella gymnastica TaxID=73025 RepID=A0A7S1J756_9EUGL|mmetsp:Transcript_72607/g.127995  ORF Transcript_72607/g.127995 Transcript_72607/m.127995 type:complete len:211 (+) Transcript_72607:569-1201(+)
MISASCSSDHLSDSSCSSRSEAPDQPSDHAQPAKAFSLLRFSLRRKDKKEKKKISCQSVDLDVQHKRFREPGRHKFFNTDNSVSKQPSKSQPKCRIRSSPNRSKKSESSPALLSRTGPGILSLDQFSCLQLPSTSKLSNTDDLHKYPPDCMPDWQGSTSPPMSNGSTSPRATLSPSLLLDEEYQVLAQSTSLPTSSGLHCVSDLPHPFSI